MSLTLHQKQRYARHLLLSEVGPGGQERLCAARFRAGSSLAEQVAAEYLRRAGLRQDAAGSPVVVTPTDEPLDAALAGAFAAVERIKAELGVGRPGSLGGALLGEGP